MTWHTSEQSMYISREWQSEPIIANEKSMRKTYYGSTFEISLFLYNTM